MQKKSYIKLLFLVVVALLLGVTYRTKAENNMISNNNWQSYISGSVTGQLQSNNNENFTMQMSSIGNSSDLQNGYNWHAQAINSLVTNMSTGHKYTMEANILSDKDRTIFLKVEGPNYTPILEKYINLKKDTEYSLKEEMIPTEDYTPVKITFALGYSKDEQSSRENIANNIEVSNISIVDKGIDKTALVYKKIEDPNVLTGSEYDDVYQYATIGSTFLQQGYIPRYQKTQDNAKYAILNALYSVPDKIYINGTDKTSNIYIQGAGIWIPLDQLNEEYNKIEITYTDNNIAHGIMYIKNGTIKKVRKKALDKIETYNQTGISKEIKNLIDTYKTKINNATTKENINELLNEFITKIDKQKNKEEIEAYIKEKIAYLEAYKDNASQKILNLITEKTNELKTLDSNIATKDQINSIITDFNNKISFRKLKETNIKLLETKAENKSNKVKKIAKAAIDKIDDDTTSTVLEVKNIYNKAVEDIEMQEAIENGLEEIEKLYTNTSSDKVKEIAKKYQELIKNETDKNEIPKLVEKAKQEIKAQTDKEEQESQINNDNVSSKNPLTVDNIFKYILILSISVIGVIISTKYYKKTIKR